MASVTKIKKVGDNPAVPTLTTPCSLNAIRLWVMAVDQLAAGAEAAALVTSTSSALTVA
jgi:hypothetical protein